MKPDQQALHERWIAHLKRMRPVAAVLVLTAIIGGLANWADVIKKIREAIESHPAQGVPAPPSAAPGTVIQINPTITVNPIITVNQPAPTAPPGTAAASRPAATVKPSAPPATESPNGNSLSELSLKSYLSKFNDKRNSWYEQEKFVRSSSGIPLVWSGKITEITETGVFVAPDEPITDKKPGTAAKVFLGFPEVLLPRLKDMRVGSQVQFEGTIAFNSDYPPGYVIAMRVKTK